LIYVDDRQRSQSFLAKQVVGNDDSSIHHQIDAPAGPISANVESSQQDALVISKTNTIPNEEEHDSKLAASTVSGTSQKEDSVVPEAMPQTAITNERDRALASVHEVSFSGEHENSTDEHAPVSETEGLGNSLPPETTSSSFASSFPFIRPAQSVIVTEVIPDEKVTVAIDGPYSDTIIEEQPVDCLKTKADDNLQQKPTEKSIENSDVASQNILPFETLHHEPLAPTEFEEEGHPISSDEVNSLLTDDAVVESPSALPAAMQTEYAWTFAGDTNCVHVEKINGAGFSEIHKVYLSCSILTLRDAK
jgi:hypothetical protein